MSSSAKSLIRETTACASSGRRLCCTGQYAIDAEARYETVCGGLQVDIARTGVVGIPDEEVHVADDWRLVCQIADVCGVLVDCSELARGQLDGIHRVLRDMRSKPLDQPLYFCDRYGFWYDLRRVKWCQVFQCVVERGFSTRRQPHATLGIASEGAHTMVHEVLAREPLGQCDGLPDTAGTGHLIGPPSRRVGDQAATPMRSAPRLVVWRLTVWTLTGAGFHAVSKLFTWRADSSAR